MQTWSLRKSYSDGLANIRDRSILLLLLAAPASDSPVMSSIDLLPLKSLCTQTASSGLQETGEKVDVLGVESERQ